jgi:hypothetical protein
LQVVHRFNQRIPDVEQDQLEVIIKEQLAVAGLVAFAADIVELVQERVDTLQVPEAQNILLFELLAGRERPSCQKRGKGAIASSCLNAKVVPNGVHIL